MNDNSKLRFAMAFHRGWDAVELLALASLELGVWTLTKAAGAAEWVADRTRRPSPKSEAP